MTTYEYDKHFIVYPQVKWNSKPLDKPFITHEELIQGGKLEFTMSDTHQ